MGQQLQAWQSEGGQRRWLSMLVDTLEQVGRPDRPGLPCAPSALIALQARLALPATVYSGSPFSLRN